MELRLTTARHYWSEGKNATWALSSAFDKSVFKWIKAQYSVLQRDRPPFHETKDKTVFFFYCDSTDIYDRTATEITAVLADARFINPLDVRWRVEQRLRSKPASDTNLQFYIDDSTISKSHFTDRNAYDRHSRRRLMTTMVVFVISLLVLGGIILFLLSNGGDTSLSPNEHAASDVSTAQTLSKGASAGSAGKSDPHTVSADMSNDTTLDLFCKEFNSIKSDEDERLKAEKCFWSYIQDQCQDGNRMPYSEWRESKSTIDECSAISEHPVDLDFRTWKEKQPKYKNLIETFFEGK